MGIRINSCSTLLEYGADQKVRANHELLINTKSVDVGGELEEEWAPDSSASGVSRLEKARDMISQRRREK